MGNGIENWKRTTKRVLSKKRNRLMLAAVLIFLSVVLAVPPPRFHDPYSLVLWDRNHALLEAAVASDQQWRFPETGVLPSKYVQALLCYEDRYFYDHPGVNPVSLLRSAWQDIGARRIISGGSTITMQVARLAEKNPPRTFLEKGWEILMAFKMELLYSKKHILELYAAHAPFGGNVVGLSAACWRFFGTAPQNLSWAQAATLAVLPNSPALIFPGKNQLRLKEKRNDLLKRLREEGLIDSLTCALAAQEPVPGPPRDMPQLAPALATRLINAGWRGRQVPTTLDGQIQQQVADIVRRYHQIYRENRVYNAGALVVDVQTGQVVAYVGNTADTSEAHGGQVDVVTALRSYGSLLKPILYMAALDAGKICPSSLLPDYPVDFDGFRPKNYQVDYDGVVPADQALIRSLNIPHVFLLKRYGTPLFLDKLRTLGFTTFSGDAAYYGLSLILGGGESSLWELTGAYAALAHRLSRASGSMTLSFLKAPSPGHASTLTTTFHASGFSRPAIWTAFRAISQLYRPGDDGHWEQFSSSQKIAWKTGTSFGNRDAWAIGVTSRYAVGVWVGNASGAGRPDLVGVRMAAPVLFDIFASLPEAPWFLRPPEGWTKMAICRRSGDKASRWCPDTVMEMVPRSCRQAPKCPFHVPIHLDPMGRYRVNSRCMDPADMSTRSWFVLSAVEQWYYQKKHSDYVPLPPLMASCRFSMTGQAALNMVYPSDGAKIYIPREREGQRGRTIFQATDRDPDAVLYWHMDDHYLGATHGTHKMEIDAPFGPHTFSIVDDEGHLLQFSVSFLQRG